MDNFADVDTVIERATEGGQRYPYWTFETLGYLGELLIVARLDASRDGDVVECAIMI